METLREIVIEKLNAYSNANDIENSIYSCAVSRTNEGDSYILETYYKQAYIKFIRNVDKTDINPVDIVSTDYKLLLPKKWDDLSKNRTENAKKIRKQGAHKCRKCNSWFTEYTESQRAAADESMCISVSCLDCGNHFKYS
jgi:DNA-directed RNA polymerase subunit M/transcription elongation factor TFIIS